MNYIPFWTYVFDGTQLVKELYGHPIREQLTRRPDMIGQTRCHRWSHGSPHTRRLTAGTVLDHIPLRQGLPVTTTVAVRTGQYRVSHFFMAWLPRATACVHEEAL
jgi:hypothetical protein